MIDESEADRWRKIARDYKCDPNDPKEAGEELTEEQQQAMDRLNGQTGYNQNPTAQPVPLVEAASEAIMSQYKFLTVEENQTTWYWEKGVYVPGAETLIAKHAEKLYGYQLANHHLTEIKGHIMRRTYHKLKEIDADINIINLKNGLYNILENRLMEHTPNYLSISQKPIVYNRRAMPKLFGKFLTQVLYPKDVKTAIDAIAYTFHRDYPIELLFILVGIGSNGKTVFTSLICSLLGVNNVSNVSLPAIINNRFAIADLENKDVNIDNELPSNVITETSIIKKLTGGRRQEIRIERKREHAYDVVLWAKLFFNANKIPDSTDTSSAYYRRIVPIAFPYQFEGKREDRQLIAKLTTEEELSGIFNILMSHLRRILKDKELHLSESTIEERRMKYERIVNPTNAFLQELREFLDEAMDEESTELNMTEKDALYNAYVRFCKKHALPVDKKETFGKNLKKLGYDEFREGRPTKMGAPRRRYWTGIRLAGEYLLEKEQETII